MSKRQQKPFRPAGKVSRLAFSEEERADPALEKPLKKAEKAADKLEKAHAKIPKKKTLDTERTLDANTAKSKVRLHFEEIVFFARTFCKKLQVKNTECCTLHFP